MKLSTKRMIFMFSGFLLLVLALLVFQNFLSPLKEEIKIKRGQFLKKNELYQTQYQAKIQLDSLLEKTKNLDNLQNSLNKILPDNLEIISVLGTFQNLIKINNLQLKGFEFKDVGSKKDIKNKFEFIKKLSVIEFNLTVVGAYNDVKNFIKNIEENVRIMNVKNLSFKFLDKEHYELNLVVEVYYQK